MQLPIIRYHTVVLTLLHQSLRGYGSRQDRWQNRFGHEHVTYRLHAMTYVFGMAKPSRGVSTLNNCITIVTFRYEKIYDHWTRVVLSSGLLRLSLCVSIVDLRHLAELLRPYCQYMFDRVYNRVHVIIKIHNGVIVRLQFPTRFNEIFIPKLYLIPSPEFVFPLN